MRSVWLWTIGVLTGVVMCGAGSAKGETYGFGGLLRRSVNVQRRLAPEVQLSNTSLQVMFPHGTNGFDGQRFTAQLETDIVQGGQAIAFRDRDPNLMLRMEVTGYDRPRVERQTQNNVTTYRAVGSATIDFQLVQANTGKVVLARAESYNVANSATSSEAPRKGLLGLPLMYNGSNANATTTDDELAQRLISKLAILVASHLVNTDEVITMLLAKGPGLDQANKLAEAGRWNEYLETLSTMQVAGSREDDAYRMYDIGVANEALGYAADDPKITLKYLREASIRYSKAMEDKETEKYFTASQGRIEKALTRYTTLDERSGQAARMEDDSRKQAANEQQKRKDGTIDNADIIKMVRGGVDPQIVLMRIRTAPAANFDMSTDGLLELSQAGVKANLITEMNQRMQPVATQPAAPATVHSTHR